jgi:hypothetical protein
MVDAPLKADTLGRLQQALNYWQALGYRFVNLPWLASMSILDYTRPPQAKGDDIYTPHGGFVASGEQSFLDLWVHGRLSADVPCIGWTPCVRQEAVFDDTHHFYFLKAELFVPCCTLEPRKVLSDMLFEAHRYFDALAPGAVIRPIDFAQKDIEIANVEVGSYGIRMLPTGEPYVYGTALAEPRLSYALERFEQKNKTVDAKA